MIKCHAGAGVYSGLHFPFQYSLPVLNNRLVKKKKKRAISVMSIFTLGGGRYDSYSESANADT